MRPDDWLSGMRNEADHAPDPQWARETRRAAWWAARRAELRRMADPKLLAVFLGVVMAPMMIFLPQPGVVYRGELMHLLFGAAMLLNQPGVSLLLLLGWMTWAILRGKAAWVVALAATLSLPAAWLGLAALTAARGGPTSWPMSTLLLALLLHAAILVGFAWAVGWLTRAGRRAST